MLEERIEVATEICVNIFYKYPDIFPISKFLHEYARNTLQLSRTEFEFYVKYSISSQFNLIGVIRQYMTNTVHLNVSLPDEYLDMLKIIFNCNIITVLKIYTRLDTIDDLNQFNQMLKDEGLIKTKITDKQKI
jgi:hypothetical protein